MPLPPLDHVARALLVEGARDDAVAFLEIVSAQEGADARCVALLGALRARPLDRVSAPPILLDAGLLERMASAGRLREAECVARAIRGRSSDADAIGAAIAQVLGPVPSGAPEMDRVAWAQALGGDHNALAALEERASTVHPSLRTRLAPLGRLLRGFRVTAPTADGEPLVPSAGAVPAAMREALERGAAARDLPAALAACRELDDGSPASTELLAALARLVVATERLMSEPSEAASGTIPMGGHGLVVLQLRMGNLEEAEKGFRRLLLEQTGDHLARERLKDVAILRAALTGARPKSEPAPAADKKRSAPGWLDKSRTKPTGEGWISGKASGHDRSAPPREDDWERDADTSVIDPVREADLLVKAGQTERAMTTLRNLLEVRPDRVDAQQRLEELQELVAQKAPMIAAEPTVRRDIRGLAEQEARRKPATFDEDEPTEILNRANPFAQTGRRSSTPATRSDVAPTSAVAVHKIVRIG